MEIEEYEDLGNYHKRLLTTKSKEAQIYCDMALNQMFGFCYPEAIRLYQKALEYDENIAFALWGISYCYGPGINYNNLPEEYYRLGYQAYLKAIEKIEFADEWEKDLINSLKYRYPKTVPETFEEKIKVMKNYRNQFRKIYKKYLNDTDIIAFYVESILTIKRTLLWNPDYSPTADASEAKEILEKVSKQGYHPHICHLLIHTLEHHPVYFKEALESAELLNKNAKGIAHLIHMPLHIFFQFGRYKECIENGIKSIEAGDIVKKRIGKYNLFTINRLHDLLFVVYSAMFSAQYEVALNYSTKIKEEFDEQLLSCLPSNINIEWYYSTYFHVLIRFGKWNDIITEEIIENEQYLITKTIQRYARAIAFAVKGNINESQKELNLFLKNKEKIPKEIIIGNNPAQAVLDVAYEMALGELLYRKKEYTEAFEHLKESVHLCDKLVFSEPWDWMQPPRHALGALLLEQEHIEESIQVYFDDLNIYPNNIWSLIGLEECYIKLNRKIDEGMNKNIVDKNIKKQLEIVKKNLSIAKEEAGINIKASCFCKNNNVLT